MQGFRQNVFASSSSPLGISKDPLFGRSKERRHHLMPPGSGGKQGERTPQTINTGISNRHKKNRLFQPPKEISPTVTDFQQDIENLPSSLSQMIQDAISYYTTTRKIKIISSYELYQTIGQGGFSKVKFGIDTKYKERPHEKPFVACKIISIGSMNAKEMQSYVMREITIMKQLNHENVVKFIDVVKSENNIYLFVELISAGDLNERIKSSGKLSETTAKQLFIQLWKGVEYCHQKEKIAHRDLKPQNILVDETPHGDVLKISDFGLAALQVDNKKKFQGQLGTLAFMAPEIRLRKSYSGFLADVYSMGMILYTMLCGEVLKLTNDQVKEAVEKKELNIEFPAHFSAEVKHLLSIMLDPDSKKRIGLSEIKYHPWCIEEFKKMEAKEEDSDLVVSSVGSPLDHPENGIKDDSEQVKSPVKKKKKRSKPNLLLTAGTSSSGNLRERKRSNSEDSNVPSRPFSSPAGKKRTRSVTSKMGDRRKMASSPLAGNDEGQNLVISPSYSNSKLIFFIRRKKIKDAVNLVEPTLQKMKCHVRVLRECELSVVYRYTDTFDKRVTLKFSITFSVEKYEGLYCTKLDFKQLSGENFAFKKIFRQLKKNLSTVK